MGYARLDENVRESTGWAEPASFSFQFTTSFGNYLDISVAVNVSYLLKMAVVIKMKHKPHGMIYNTSCMRPRPGIVMWLAGKWHVISLISLVMNKQYSCSTGQPVLLASMWSFTEGKKTDWRNDSIAVNFFIPDIHDYESSHLNTAAWTHKECRGFSLFQAYPHGSNGEHRNAATFITLHISNRSLYLLQKLTIKTLKQNQFQLDVDGSETVSLRRFMHLEIDQQNWISLLSRCSL